MGKNRQKQHRRIGSTNSNNNSNSNNSNSNNNNNNNNNNNSGNKQSLSSSGGSSGITNNNNNNNNNTTTNNNDNHNTNNKNNQPKKPSKASSKANEDSFLTWLNASKHWVLLSIFIGFVLGMGIGTGLFTGDIYHAPKPWRIVLGKRIRHSALFRTVFRTGLGSFMQGDGMDSVKVGSGSGRSGKQNGKSRKRDQDRNKNVDTNNNNNKNDNNDDNSESKMHSLMKMCKSLNPISWYESISTWLRDLWLGGGIASASQPFYHDMYDPNYRYIDMSGSGQSIRDSASDPLAYLILREAIQREEGGYVHPDLGLMVPAPCGAARGLGMVRDTYHQCQIRCIPGIASEKIHPPHHHPPDAPPYHKATFRSTAELQHALDAQSASPQLYRQEEILLRIPLDAQMTRSVALHTLQPLLPADVSRRIPLEELDDATLLILLLAHERGRGVESPFQPYIATLPINPSCGFSPILRSEMLRTISVMGAEMGMDVDGWPGEVFKAAEYSERIAEALARDYGPYMIIPKGVSAFATLHWAVCQVSSRAIAASEKHGALRMVPLIDMINHDVHAGEFVELTGKETMEYGDFINALSFEDSGTFVVRSIRHGRRKPLKKGQELLVNYNVDNYSPLDWFLNMGFVPPERSEKWIKIEAGLPKVRSHHRNTVISTAAAAAAGMDVDMDMDSDGDVTIDLDLHSGHPNHHHHHSYSRTQSKQPESWDL